MQNSALADEVLMEFLHDELVNYATRTEGKDQLDKPMVLTNLEYFGFKTGYRIIERLTKDTPRFVSELDTVKFICTDFWNSLFKKHVNCLQTNNLGVYVLRDDSFRFLNKISNGLQYLESAPLYIAFTTGIIRGALANMGIDTIVNGEVKTMPVCKFHITVQRTPN